MHITDQDKKNAIAVRVLGIGKRLAPDRFPNLHDEKGDLNMELVEDWAMEFATVPWGMDLWEEATRHWVRTVEHHRMVTTGELLRSARAVVKLWESDPVKGARLEQWREGRRAERDRELAAGTFAANRGRAIEAPDGGKREPSEFAKRVLEGNFWAEIQRRSKNNSPKV